MKTEIKFNEVVTACGNCLRAHYKGYRLESDGETWVNIIDSESRTETCAIDANGDVVSEGGECVTESWTTEDWVSLANAFKPNP